MRKRITYHDKYTVIELGDLVETRIWFRKKHGQVVYVPGVSQRNDNMEYYGLQWVGIQIVDGPFVATVVDPDDKTLGKKIKFIARGKVDKILQPEENPFKEEA